MTQAPQTFVVSFPPSVNSIWRAVNGRNILSARYRQWRDTAGKELIIQKPKKIAGPVKIAIELSPPDKRAYDLDNRVKAVFDLLVDCQVIKSDNHLTIPRFEVSIGEGFTGARVTVIPLTAEQARERAAA